MHLEYSPSFAALIFDEEIDSGMALDPEVTDEELMPPKSQYHGFEFTNMYNLDKAVDL